MSVDEYRANLRETVRVARAANIRVFLLTRPFTGDSPFPLWWKNFAPEYNAATIEIAREEGVGVIDVFEYFREHPEWFADESHFNEAGHEALAQLVYDHIYPTFMALVPASRD